MEHHKELFSLVDLFFYLLAFCITGASVYAVFSRNIARSVFSLLFTFFGVAVFYGMLAFDFVAIVQLMVYVGGILVLLLFAVMLTGNIEIASGSSRSAGLKLGIPVGLLILIGLITLAWKAPWTAFHADKLEPKTAAIGNMLLNQAILPFEAVSVVLLGVLIGAVALVRQHQKPDDQPSKETQA